MNPYIDEDLTALAAHARRFADGRVAPGFVERDKTRVLDRTLMREMGELGFIAPELPERFGTAWRIRSRLETWWSFRRARATVLTSFPAFCFNLARRIFPIDAYLHIETLRLTISPQRNRHERRSRRNGGHQRQWQRRLENGHRPDQRAIGCYSCNRRVQRSRVLHGRRNHTGSNRIAKNKRTKVSSRRWVI